MDFAARPRVNNPSARPYRPQVGRRTQPRYAAIVSHQNSVLRTSLRSLIHATDSTCSGWMPKRAATQALGHIAPVNRSRTQNSSTVLVRCSATLVTWNPPG